MWRLMGGRSLPLNYCPFRTPEPASPWRRVGYFLLAYGSEYLLGGVCERLALPAQVGAAGLRLPRGPAVSAKPTSKGILGSWKGSCPDHLGRVALFVTQRLTGFNVPSMDGPASDFVFDSLRLNLDGRAPCGPSPYRVNPLKVLVMMALLKARSFGEVLCVTLVSGLALALQHPPRMFPLISSAESLARLTGIRYSCSRDRKRCQPGIRRRYFHDPSSARPGKPRVFGFRGEYGCKAET